MDKRSPNRHQMDIESEMKRCQGELAGLSHIIDEVEGDLGRVGRTLSLILHQVPDLTLDHLNSSLWTTSLTRMRHHQTGDPISSPRTTIKLSPTITSS